MSYTKHNLQRAIVTVIYKNFLLFFFSLDLSTSQTLFELYYTCFVNSVIRVLLTKPTYSCLSSGFTTLPSPPGSNSTRRPSLKTVENVHSLP